MSSYYVMQGAELSDGTAGQPGSIFGDGRERGGVEEVHDIAASGEPLHRRVFHWQPANDMALIGCVVREIQPPDWPTPLSRNLTGSPGDTLAPPVQVSRARTAMVVFK